MDSTHSIFNIAIYQPPGGVKKGEIFTTPALCPLNANCEEMFTFKNKSEVVQWKYNIFSCTDDPSFMTTLFCPHGKPETEAILEYSFLFSTDTF